MPTVVNTETSAARNSTTRSAFLERCASAAAPAASLDAVDRHCASRLRARTLPSLDVRRRRL